MCASSRLSVCDVFRRSSAAKRSEFINKILGCSACTSWELSTSECSQRRHGAKLCSIEEGLSVCAKEHHKLLHILELRAHRESVAPKVQTQGTEAHTKPDMTSTVQKELFALYRAHVISTNRLEATSSFILGNPGARDNFIIPAFAEELELPSEPVTADIKMLEEGHKTYQARIYQFQIEDMTKEMRAFNSIGVDRIVSIDKAPQARKLAHWFPGMSTMARQAFDSP